MYLYKKKEYSYGWFELLQQFCQEKHIQSKYIPLKKILNKVLVPHWKDKIYFADRKYLSYEQELGDQIIDDYYDESNPINDDDFIRDIVQICLGKLCGDFSQELYAITKILQLYLFEKLITPIGAFPLSLWLSQILRWVQVHTKTWIVQKYGFGSSSSGVVYVCSSSCIT